MKGVRARAALVVLAVAARVAAIVVLQSHLVPRSTYEHGEIASNLIAGRGFSVMFLGVDGPTSQQAPIYPALLAVAYAIGGDGTPTALLLMQLAQAVLGGLLVWETMALAARIFDGKVAPTLLAGAIVAVQPTLVYSATHIQVAGLAALLTVSTLSRGYRAAETGRGSDAILTGLVFGLLLLTDPILGLVLPGVFLAIARVRGLAGAVRSIAVVGVVASVVVAPWIVRNHRVHGELVFVKSTFGYAFWQGNCALSEGTDKVVRASVEAKLAGPSASLADMNARLWEARHEAGYLDDIALTRADRRMLATLSEPERSRVLFRRALADLANDPLRYPRLCLRRLRYFFLFDETNPKTRNAVYRISIIGLTATALVGLAAMPRPVRRRVVPLLWTIGSVALFHSLTIVSARFHVPIEPLFAILAGGIATRFRYGSAPATDDVEGVGVEGSVLVSMGHRRRSLDDSRFVPERHRSMSEHGAANDPREPDHSAGDVEPLRFVGVERFGGDQCDL
ncbi:MAG: glycosyltransferase family 39 protein [Isosphaeraceae bacterium]|nr:glycosyltransferase family 39 protein [Isosphaeraceae bacterium]